MSDVYRLTYPGSHGKLLLLHFVRLNIEGSFLKNVPFIFQSSQASGKLWGFQAKFGLVLQLTLPWLQGYDEHFKNLYSLFYIGEGHETSSYPNLIKLQKCDFQRQHRGHLRVIQVY